MRTQSWKIAAYVCSVFAPGTGHLLSGMWTRGAAWLGGVFAGGAVIYGMFASAPAWVYTLFGFTMAFMATRDLWTIHNRPAAQKEEPIILKP